MPLIKSLFTTLYSRVDHVVNRIENHDAVIEATIKDIRRALAQAKGYLGKVRNDGQKLSQQLTTNIDNAHKWQQRAKDFAEKDEATAITCLARRRNCKRQIQVLEAALAQHQAIETRLVADIDKLEQRLDKIARQRNQMRARQSAADALGVTQSVDLHQMQEVDELFDRWEMKISESELMAGEFDSMDVMEKKFLDEEAQKDLRAELQKIIIEKEDQS